MEGLLIKVLSKNDGYKSIKYVDPIGLVEMPFEAALSKAEAMELDLVQVSDEAVPVCKFMDYSKYEYEQQKKAKANKKNKVELKEVRIGATIAEHDLKVKANTASRILREGDKVKITVVYKGRMIQQIQSGKELLRVFCSVVEQCHSIDKAPTIEGNRISMVISPK